MTEMIRLLADIAMVWHQRLDYRVRFGFSVPSEKVLRDLRGLGIEGKRRTS